MLRLRDRCQVKHRYEGAEAQCQKAWRHTMTDTRTGDAYRCCSQHARMACEGKIGAFGRVLPAQKIQNMTRHGGPPPHVNRYRVTLNTKKRDEKDNG